MLVQYVARPPEMSKQAPVVKLHYLASEECSFTTGACFDISDGRATY